MSSRKKANKTYRHGWASEGKAKKERNLAKSHLQEAKQMDGGWLTNCHCGIDQPHRHPEKDGKFDWKKVEMLEWESKTELMDWSKDWLGYVATYVKRYCPDIEDWKLISIAGNLEQVVIHNKEKFKEQFSQRQEKGLHKIGDHVQ